MPAQARRRRWLRPAAAALGVVGALLLAEVGVRLAPASPAAPGKVVASVGAVQTDFALRRGVECYPTNPRGYFREGLVALLGGEVLVHEPDFQEQVPRAEVDRRPYGVAWETDAYGTRGPDPAVGKPPGARRVLAVGDSFTFGEGVFVADTYVARLGALLGAEAVNGGRPDTGLADYPTRLREQLIYDPDLVVLGLVLNDGLMSAEVHRRQQWLNDKVVVRNRRREVLLGRSSWHGWSALLDRWRAARLDAQVSRQTIAWYHAIYDARQNPAGVAASKAALAELAAIARAADVRLVVALFPLLEWRGGEYPFTAIHATLQAWCDDAGLPVIDLLPAWRETPCEELWVYPTDHHPNEVAHALAAEALAESIRARGW